MPIIGRYFPTQSKKEKVFLLIRRHWIVFFAIFFFMAVLLVPPIVLIFYWFYSPETFVGEVSNFALIFGSTYTLIVFGLILYGFVNYYLDVYIVTNERLVDIKQNGFFRRDIAELHLRQIQDVEARVEGFLQTLLHYGNIHIQTAGERENFIFEDVPHPYTTARKIIELHQAQVDRDKMTFAAEEDGSRKSISTKSEIDDFRPEEYSEKTATLAENKVSGVSSGDEKKLESNNQPREVALSALSDQRKKRESELRELIEGREVRLDDEN